MRTFPDGGNYRIEVSGIETANVFLKTAQAFKDAGIPWHRAICCVRGAGYQEVLYSADQLKDIIKIGADYGVEIVITPYSRAVYQDTAIQAQSDWGRVSGIGWRGKEGVDSYINDLKYLYDVGFRAFLVWSPGMLNHVLRLIGVGHLSRDIVLKISVFTGISNPVDVELVKTIYNTYRLPVGLTINPVTDLTVQQLEEIRLEAGGTTLDVHSRIFDNWGGNDRIDDAYSIVQYASPVYFKDEPGPGVEMYHPDYPEEDLLRCKLDAVDAARRIIENVNDSNEMCGTDFKVSGWAPEDLRLSVVN